MPFPQLNAYIAGALAGDVAGYLNVKAANFHNVANYFSGVGNFTEGTVQSVMFMKIDAWVNANENPNHVLILSQQPYVAHSNCTDLVVVYDDGIAPVQSIYIEVKVNESDTAVDNDIEVLTAEGDIVNSPLTAGYAFYTVRPNQNWPQYIVQAFAPIFKVAINLNY